MRSSQIRILLVSLLAVFAVSAVASGSAQAEGPVWTGHFCIKDASGVWMAKCKAAGTGWEKSVGVLPSGEKEPVASKNIGSFTLKGTTIVVCTGETDTGEIIGGNPGTDTSEVKFTKCAVKGKPECEASSGSVNGEVVVKGLKTVLVYKERHPKAGETSEEKAKLRALDAFTPEKENLFVEFKFTISATKCGTLSGTTVKVKAIGTEITEPAFNQKCGLLAEVGKIVNEKFVATEPGQIAVAGALNFPEPAITKAWLEKAGGTWEDRPIRSDPNKRRRIRLDGVANSHLWQGN
jgi:hypothetical protein